MGRQKKWTAEDCERIARKTNSRLSLIKETFTNSREKCLWAEENHGYFFCSPQLLMRGKQKGHPRGASKRISESRTRSFAEVRQALKQEFPFFEIDSTTYVGSTKKCLIYDKEKNIHFWGTPTQFLSGCVKGNPKTTYQRISSKLRLDSDIVERRVKEKNPCLKLVKSTYKNSHIKCQWEEKGVGLFWARPNDILCGSQIGHPSLHRLRCSKSANNAVTIKNWENGDEVLCHGGYELEVALYFNRKRIRYVSKAHVFTLPDGRTYCPDFYLKDENKYLEIKGYFWGDAKEKWIWFHRNQPNSELWNERKLVSMGLRPRAMSIMRKKLGISLEEYSKSGAIYE